MVKLNRMKLAVLSRQQTAQYSEEVVVTVGTVFQVGDGIVCICPEKQR
jgi:hypothetical protein